MTQATLKFDAYESRVLADAGMKASARNKALYLEIARQNAKHIARDKGAPITADDVRRHMDERGYPDILGNGWGSLFVTGEWEWTGEYRRSTLTTNHGNLQKVWGLK